MQDILKALNVESADERLQNLKSIIDEETEKPDFSDCFVNNHIHTTYSFSPYSPTAAVYCARKATLPTAGIMDHDSIAGAWEFIRAGEIAGVETTVGIECRVRMDGTSVEDRFINNQDQTGLAYMSLHGVPHGQIDKIQKVFEPLREKRNVRNRKMVDNINSITEKDGITIDFDKDVLSVSQFRNGGTVTERHIIFALSKKIVDVIGKDGTLSFLSDKLEIPLSQKHRDQLSDSDNPFFEYDLLGALKSEFVDRIYIPATDECMHISQLSDLAKQTDSLLCYAYLGDVGTSVTGDKRSGRFEDSYLDELLYVLKGFSVDAVTYMPSRNTSAQLERIRKLCAENEFFEISGEDINSPRQCFICEQLANPEYRHLVDATWQLIRREKERS
ncbi:MAG: PHP domain-containing protein [Clostridia bacterium]|nr:PHP domain-containing protein [Clostridia bacterium]